MWRIRQAERAVRGKKVWFHGRGREREGSTRAACGAYGSPRARYATSVAIAFRAAEKMGKGERQGLCMCVCRVRQPKRAVGD